MAYTATYKVHFTNEQNQDVLATIYKKDGPVVNPVPEYACSLLEIYDKSEGLTKYDSTIITRELTMSIWSDEDDVITWETFIASAHDDWKIDVVIDDQKYFEGFITPDEGNALFQDKPYEVKIVATNGLALLKDIPLVDINGNNFSADHKLIDYIAGALKKTSLELPIRIRCNYFNESMNDKGDSLNNDMFNQAYLNYRTFQKDATTFVSCYDALKIILDKFCRLEYWFGYWQIKCIAELQYLPGSDYYVDFDANGSNPTGAVEAENYAQIGKAVDIYPINEDQQIYSLFAIKSAKTIYNYVPLPEIPKNNKFERGTLFETTVNGDITTKKFTISDWTFGRTDPGSPSTFPPNMIPTTDISYRQSAFNQFGIETDREIILENGTDPGHRFLMSEGMPVSAHDKVVIDFDFRQDPGGTGTKNYAFIFLVASGSNNRYALENNNPSDGGGPYFWITSTNTVQLRFLSKFYENGENWISYSSFSIETPPMPEDGTLYFCFMNFDSTNTKSYYRNFSFEYKSFIAGGYIQVKGDYWIRSQNTNFPDVAEDEVGISDSIKKMLKGALLLSSGALTSPKWYRYAGIVLPESKHFKELLNIARYNHSYRRMYAIEGSFNGLNYSAQNDQLNKFPIGFHKRYRMVDMTNPRDFVLVPPLKMDLIKGWVSANLVEVVNPANSNDGTQAGDSSSFNYIF